MTTPLIHIGLHRTGSTWFQTRALDGLDGRPVNAVPDRAESAKRIVLTRDIDFDATEVRAWLSDAFDRAAHEGSAPVLSNERFSGNPAGGWHDFEQNMQRLAEVVPDGRVLAVIREQGDLLRSIWLQQVRIGHPAGIEDFLRPPAPGDHRLPVVDPAFLRFDRMVAHLDEVFGPDRVLVLPYELLREDPATFLGRIESFSGIEFPAPDPGRVFAAPSLLEAGLQRWSNLLSSRSSLHRAPPFPSLEPTGRRLSAMVGRWASHGGEQRRRARVDAVIEARLAGLDLRGSNRRLSARIGLDLATMGWPT